ncbi:MAG TPA: mechanosensitive ion channel family protein [Gaiellaceae bacterium]|nr:mechanosensitive ion channel family protein [Gaiellaceae bacterium]
MDTVLDLLLETDTASGRLATTAAIVVLSLAVGSLAGRILASRVDDAYARYHVRNLARYVMWVVALIAIAIVWRAFAGRAGIVLGLAAAGIAFAMQEVVGAVAGWFNIISGRIYRVGDRVQVGGVQGDVIDITPLRTKLLEIGSTSDDAIWVKGRQFTGRIVSVSNKATFVEPVFNFSAFEFIWEELTLEISGASDWHEAERIMREEAAAVSRLDGAHEAVEEMARRYPLPRTEIEPRVYVQATPRAMRLSARFVVPVRRARSVKDELARRIDSRFAEAGIEIATEALDVRISTDERS